MNLWVLIFALMLHSLYKILNIFELVNTHLRQNNHILPVNYYKVGLMI